MADYSAYEGQSVAGPDGTVYKVTGGQLIGPDGKAFSPEPVGSVSQGAFSPTAISNDLATVKDVGKSIIPGLAQGLVALKTAPAEGADMAAKGIAAGAGYLPNVPGASTVGSLAQKADTALTPYTYGPQMADAIKTSNALGYQPQTLPGKFTQQVGAAFPSVALGGEGVLPTVARTLGTAAGKTAVSQFTDNPWANMGGALLGYGGVPTGMPAATTPRANFANVLAREGVPVSAAERTGSAWRAALEGQSPGDRSKQISDIMLQKGGITRQPGDTRPISALINDRGQALDTQVKGLKANTNLPVSNGLWNDLGNMDLQHTNIGTGAATGAPTSIIDPQVHQAYEDFENLVSGTRNLTGEQYNALSQKWGTSDNPTIRQMGRRLDQEMETAHPEWAEFNTNYANYKGLKAASDKAGGSGTLQGLDPADVRSSMYKPTDLRNFAEAAEGITGKYPSHPDLKEVSKVLGLAAAGLGGATHGVQGLEAGLPFGLGQFDPVVSALQRGARSGLGQKYLLMNPQAAGAALYATNPPGTSEGTVPK